MNAPLSAGLSAGLSATTLTWAAVIAALAAAGLARWLTLILITRATRLGLDDVPNHRSSHHRITPRGGGLAVVAATVIVLGAVAAAGLAAGNGRGEFRFDAAETGGEVDEPGAYDAAAGVDGPRGGETGRRLADGGDASVGDINVGGLVKAGLRVDDAAVGNVDQGVVHG